MSREMLGETIKEFKITARLGRGGMGEVWAAEQQLVHTRVAIKVLREDVSTDAEQVQRFFNEAVAASKIKHAGIVKIFDVGFHAGRAFLIMELLEGESLAARIRRAGALPIAEVIELGRQLASVLAATHAADITHRDLKPDNVFLVADAELAHRERAKVLDFGIAKLGAGLGMTAANGSMGTPPYMAPELWTDAATADARADVYALGCLVFEMACGRPPFVAASIGEACSKHLTEVPVRAATLAPEIPPELDELIARMLEKAPGARPTMQAIVAVFGRLSGAPVSVVTARMGPELPALAETVPFRAPVPTDALGDTTLRSAAAAVGAPVAGPSAATRRGRRVMGMVFGAAAVAAGLVIYLSPPSAPATIGRPAPPKDASPPRALPVALVLPKLGLGAVDQFRDPTTSAVSDLHSESLWTAARDDFAAACAQAGAPAADHTRWCAARAFAEGQAAMNRRDVPAAAVAFREAIAVDATWPVPLVALAGALSYHHDLDGALAAARSAQRLDPAWWQAVAAGGRAYSAAHRGDDAIGEYRRALALAPKNAVLLAEIALAYHAAGMDVEADKYGDQALALDDGLVAVHLMRAERRLELSDGKGALAEADRALEVSPKNGAALLARGDALALLHDKPRAMDAYARALDLVAEQQTSMPDARVALVRAAVAKDELPAPRAQPVASPRSGTRSTPARPPADGHAPPRPSPARSRPGCGPGDPMCASDSL